MEQSTSSGKQLASGVASRKSNIRCEHSRCIQRQKNENELSRFFEQSLDLQCVAGLDGRFKRLNPAWSRQLGWSEDELFANPFINFVHPDDRESTLVKVGSLAEGIKTVLFENRYRHKDGSYHWLQWNGQPDPEHQLIYATARDISLQKRLEREILEISDREKERLGQDLHDGLCQTLAGIAALSSTLSQQLVSIPNMDRYVKTATEINSHLKDAIRDARDLARGLHPIGINAVGLTGALEELTSNIHNFFSIMCTFKSRRMPHRLQPDMEVQLFRIAQEAINNAVSHAQAKHIGIVLIRQNEKGILTITDDGVGLPKNIGKVAGMGLHTMNYRALRIDADLNISSNDNGGTTVSCSFPIERSISE